MSYILSIVVPTKDRYEYLKPLIQLIKSFNSNEIELVIQDNTADNSEILDYLKDNSFLDLKYFHVSGQLSVAKNSDLAILNSTGKYVCFIGDDDGVSGHIVSAVKWMDENGVEALKTAFCNYKWPSFSFSRISKLSSSLIMGFYDKRCFRLNAKTQLIKMLETGGHKFRYMPKVYHGIVKRDILNEIYKLGGTFFPGASPDVANSVALSFIVENFVFMNFPIVIPGNSSRTGGDVQKYKKLRAAISEVPFLPENTEKDWEDFIPKIWSGETIIPESACKSLRYMGAEDYIDKYLNKEKMLAEFILNHSDLHEMVTKKHVKKFHMYNYLLLLYLNRYVNAAFNKVLNALFSIRFADNFYSGSFLNKKNYVKIIDNLNDITDANKFLMDSEPEFSLPNTIVDKS